MTQLDLFPQLTPSVVEVHHDLCDTKEKLGNLRRGLFKRHDAMEKEIADLRSELSSLRLLLQTDPRIHVL